MNTTTSNTQSEINSQEAAEKIIELFEEHGFTSDAPVDNLELKQEISDVIQYHLYLK